MNYSLKRVDKFQDNENLLFIISDLSQIENISLEEKEKKYIKEKFEDKQKSVFINRLNSSLSIIKIGEEEDVKEFVRRESANIWLKNLENNFYKIYLINYTDESENTLLSAEGIILRAYSFDKYKTEDKKDKSLELLLVDKNITDENVSELDNLCKSVYLTRDLVNEPVGSLSSVKLGEKVLEFSKEFGFTAEVYEKKKIEALKMGGLLGVNQGSIDPPTFSILEWRPENAVNDKPIVLVGKGVVYDTGGVNLKTPPGSLDTMKCDMGGAASVVGTLSALALNKLPIYVVGLIPSTDNRLTGNTIVPGDVLKMHNGKTVEIMNTDAEGRLILADALSFAENYNPELVIDLATLTGNAAIALGSYGTVGMGTASTVEMDKLQKAGDEVCERVVWFPFWSDYDALIKSDVADIKNVGGREGGAITAGKFLAHFVKSPWLHLDIAGSAFVTAPDSYRPLGGTGVGVRMLYRFFQNIINEKK